MISQANKELHAALTAIGYVSPFGMIANFSLFTLPSSLASQAFSTILSRPTFFKEFLETNRSRLSEHYSICTRILRENSIPYYPANAGFFVWADLSAYLDGMTGDTDLERETEMNKRLLDGGLHLATSEQFQGEEYGWMRITFAVEKEVLELGLKR